MYTLSSPNITCMSGIYVKLQQHISSKRLSTNIRREIMKNVVPWNTSYQLITECINLIPAQWVVLITVKKSSFISYEI